MKGGKSKVESRKSESKLAVKKPNTKKEKKAKDPNKPKRPPSAFFVFMEGFRKQFKVENPENKAVSAVAKAGGISWKSMSEEEKAPYVVKAEERKGMYEKEMQAYDRKLKGEEEDSDKSKSEVHDGEDEGSVEEGHDEN